MKILAIFVLSLIFNLAQSAEANSFQKKCSHYAGLRSPLSQTQAEKSCQSIDNRYALACSKIAITYLYKIPAIDTLKICAAIKNEKGLKCFADQALHTNVQSLNKIKSCS